MARRLRKSRKLYGGSLHSLRPANFITNIPLPTPSRQSGGNSYVQNIAGNPQQQYNTVFSQHGPYGAIPGNTLIGQQGQGIIPQSYIPNYQQLAMAQNAGGSKKRSWGPLDMFDILNTRKKYSSKLRSKRNRKSRR